jgi:hypothetical protein
MRQKQGYSLNFSSNFCHFFKNEISGKKGAKSKAIALAFRPFFATF